MKAVSASGGPKVPADASVEASVGVGPRSEGGFGLEITGRVALPVKVTPENLAYLRTKKDQMGHLLGDLGEGDEGDS